LGSLFHFIDPLKLDKRKLKLCSEVKITTNMFERQTGLFSEELNGKTTIQLGLKIFKKLPF
jgi:hypothetical protein